MARSDRIGRATACVLLAILAACSSASAPNNTSSSARPVATQPLGLIAIGHSGLTGYASDPTNIHSDQLANSWATGTNPAVNSIYQRWIKSQPSIRGHVANTALDGSEVEALAGEITTAFQSVPFPQLVIIQTIDNDINTCDLNSAAIEAERFGTTLRAALDLIVRKSPQTKILTMAQFGRPAGYLAVTKSVPDVVQESSGDGPCDLFNSSGVLVPEHVAALTHVIELFEMQVSKVCGQVAQCHYTDVSARYVDRLENLARDEWNHVSVEGHAAWAALMWPIVAELENLPTS